VYKTSTKVELKPMETRLQQLIQELEDLIQEETEGSNNPWITRSRLDQLFHQKYGSPLENLLQTHGYYDLKLLLRKTNIFAIYQSPIPQQFYISLLQKTVSGSPKSSIPRPIKKNSSYRPKYPTKIISQDDLKCTLVEMVRNLSRNKTENPITIDQLNNKFYKNYGQNLRDVRRKICPDLNLVNLLQTIPELKLEKINDTWQITLNIS
jgi:hypothetical protein